MKKTLLLALTVALAGCLVTETRKVETKGRKAGDLWWRDPQYGSSAAVVSSSAGCCPSDEEYFQENSFRWPDDWKQRHPQAPTPQPEADPAGKLY